MDYSVETIRIIQAGCENSIEIIQASCENSLVWTVLGVRDPESAAMAIVKVSIQLNISVLCIRKMSFLHIIFSFLG